MKATRPSIRIMTRATARAKKAGQATSRARAPKANLIDVVVALDALHLRIVELEKKIAGLNAYH